MSSKIDRPAKSFARSAAWRISLWGTLAFVCGTLVVFMVLNQFIANDIQRRTDAWLSGEVQTLGDVASRTPQGRVYARVVREVAELASHEVPGRRNSTQGTNDSVFFMQIAPDGSPTLWVGRGDGHSTLNAVRTNSHTSDTPFHLSVQGATSPFRVVSIPLGDGSHIYLGVSERDQAYVLKNLRVRFLLLWLLNVALGFVIIFFITRSMLTDVREITEAASRIGESDLSQRVPTNGHYDEVHQLAFTLNNMLDRIERSVGQLHTVTNSLAHDVRSPLTAIRAKLETALTSGTRAEEIDSIVATIDEVDHLTEILTKSLDVAEAQAGALHLNRTNIDLDHLFRTMIDLYEPSMSERGLKLVFNSHGVLYVTADPSLLHRVVANLFDNEIKHLPPSSTVSIILGVVGNLATITIRDDGRGFSVEVRHAIFETRVKRSDSPGYGLGLSFIKAVVGAHGGTVSAVNHEDGGALLTITLPLSEDFPDYREQSLTEALT